MNCSSVALKNLLIVLSLLFALIMTACAGKSDEELNQINPDLNPSSLLGEWKGPSTDLGSLKMERRARFESHQTILSKSCQFPDGSTENVSVEVKSRIDEKGRELHILEPMNSIKGNKFRCAVGTESQILRYAIEGNSLTLERIDRKGAQKLTFQRIK